MGLKIETWSIAFRKKKEGLLFDDTSEFILIDNGHKGWYADPFLYDYKGKTFLFAEYYSYKLGKGILVCSEYDDIKDCFGEFAPIIIEDYHLSYPNVFELNNKLYLMPESHKSNSLYLYEAVNFPYEWKKSKVLLRDIRLVDTTLFADDENLFAISMRIDESNPENHEKMLLLSIDKESLDVTSIKTISDDISIARPGGKVLSFESNVVFVTQDCKNSYGKALNLLKAYNFNADKPCLEVIKRIQADDIDLNYAEKPSGIHTYNVSDKFEVIDLKYYRRSYYRVLRKIIRKIKG